MTTLLPIYLVIWNGLKRKENPHKPIKLFRNSFCVVVENTKRIFKRITIVDHSKLVQFDQKLNAKKPRRFIIRTVIHQWIQFSVNIYVLRKRYTARKNSFKTEFLKKHKNKQSFEHRLPCTCQTTCFCWLPFAIRTTDVIELKIGIASTRD